MELNLFLTLNKYEMKGKPQMCHIFWHEFLFWSIRKHLQNQYNCKLQLYASPLLNYS